MHASITNTLNQLAQTELPAARRKVLDELVRYILHKNQQNEAVKLVFICTHNSRRSQLAQIWAHVAAHYHNIEATCYSGGTEVTAFNERAVAALERAGFQISKENTGQANPVYQVNEANTCQSLAMYSKRYDDPHNPTTGFAAIMTCADADENCPVIPGAEARIPLRYDDPQSYDNTPQEAAKYDERSNQIAAEMLYVFAKVKEQQ